MNASNNLVNDTPMGIVSSSFCPVCSKPLIPTRGQFRCVQCGFQFCESCDGEVVDCPVEE